MIIKCKKVQSFKYEINPCKPVFNSALILELRTCDQTVNYSGPHYLKH